MLRNCWVCFCSKFGLIFKYGLNILSYLVHIWASFKCYSSFVNVFLLLAKECRDGSIWRWILSIDISFYPLFTWYNFCESIETITHEYVMCKKLPVFLKRTSCTGDDDFLMVLLHIFTSLYSVGCRFAWDKDNPQNHTLRNVQYVLALLLCIFATPQPMSY